MTRAASSCGRCFEPRWWAVLLALVCCLGAHPSRAQSPDLPDVRAGAALNLVVVIPGTASDRPVAFSVAPGEGVSMTSPAAGPVGDSDDMTIAAALSAWLRPGVLRALTVTFTYASGRRVTTMTCDLNVVAPRTSGPESVESPLAHVLEPGGAPRDVLGQLGPAVIGQPVPAMGAPVPNRREVLRGSVYVGATELDAQGAGEAELGMGLHLKGRVRGNTQVDLSYLRGWNPGVSPIFRYGMHRSRGHLRIRTPSVSFEAGEIRPSSVFTGIPVVADGVMFDKSRGVLVGSLAVGRPKYFAGGWGGHVAQGTIGLGFPAGSVSLVGSDFARPVTSSRIVANTIPPDDSELVVEDLERVGILFSRENRVRSGGIETRLSSGRHRLTAGGGWTELFSTADARVDGPTANGTYSFTGGRGSMNAQFRRSPPSLPGMVSAGDSTNLGGKLKVAPAFALTAQAFRSEMPLLGRPDPVGTRGVSAGVAYSRRHTRFHVQGHYRELQFLATTVTRSVAAGVRSSAGIFGVNGALEYGQADDGRRERRIVSYRGALYAEGERASLMFSGGYRDYGVSRPRVSLDLSGSVQWAAATIEGGAGVSRTGIFGDLATFWTTLEVPVPGESSLMLGADYNRWSFANSPYFSLVSDWDDGTPQWRFTFTVTRKLSVPLPFLTR